MMRAQPLASHFIDGAYVEDAAGRVIESIYPATGEVIARVHSATPEIVEPRRRVGEGGAEGMGADGSGRARAGVAPGRRFDPRAQPGTQHAGNARYRQADPGDAGGGRHFGRRRAGIFRRPRRGDRGPAHRPRRRRLRLYPPRAARRLRRHRRVELSDADRLLEGRARAGLRQRHGLQAVGEHPALHAEDR